MRDGVRRAGAVQPRRRTSDGRRGPRAAASPSGTS